MASLHILKSPSFAVSRSSLGSVNVCRRRPALQFQICRGRTGSRRRRKCFQLQPVRCSVSGGGGGGGSDGDNNQNDGEEERPESLFMKELKRRGMTPTSLLEEKNRSGGYGVEVGEEEEAEERGGGGGFPRRNARVSTEIDDKSLTNQRERSMALNSEGIEGLVPRAKLLLTIGGTFFLGFWPLILLTIVVFSGLYFYFGPSFVHDATGTPIAPPQYIDPYALLEDERISQIAPSLR